MEFIEYDEPHALERCILLQHPREHALGDHFNARLARHPGVHAHAMADGPADLLAQGARHARGDRAGCESSRFKHDDAAALEPFAVEHGEWHHGAFAGTGRGLQYDAGGHGQRGGQFRNDRLDRQPGGTDHTTRRARHEAMANITQPPIRSMPPSGVVRPNTSGAPKVT